VSRKAWRRSGRDGALAGIVQRQAIPGDRHSAAEIRRRDKRVENMNGRRDGTYHFDRYRSAESGEAVGLRARSRARRAAGGVGGGPGTTANPLGPAGEARHQESRDRTEVADDRTVIFHFKEPFVDFIDMYNGVVSGIGWVVPRQYYEKVGADEFKQKPVGAGPYKLVSQEAGTQMVFEAWADYWRQVPATKATRPGWR
jgi:ABC-type transport system substrate-binding protein